MTTHQYPAVLLPQEVEDIERAVAAYRHTLVQAYIHAREWQRQAEQMSASLNAERAAHEATKRGGGLAQALTELGEAMRLREGFMRQIAFIEQERDAARARADAAERRLAEQDNAPPTITRIPNPNICPRCGNGLNNVSPGISVVSPGINICTPCLRPGEVEIARARGL